MIRRQRDVYLKEDEDLLDELKKIGSPTSGIAEMGSMHKLTVIQIQATLRSRKTASDLNEGTTKFGKAQFAASAVLFVVAVLQLVTSIFLSGVNRWEGFGMEVIALLTILLVIYKISNDMKSGPS